MHFKVIFVFDSLFSQVQSVMDAMCALNDTMEPPMTNVDCRYARHTLLLL